MDLSVLVEESQGVVGLMAATVACTPAKMRQQLAREGLVELADATRAAYGVTGPRAATTPPRLSLAREKEQILQALEATAADMKPEQRILQGQGWNREAAAERLGWSRRTFFRRMAEHQIKPPVYTRTEKRAALKEALRKAGGTRMDLARYFNVAYETIRGFMVTYKMGMIGLERPRLPKPAAA